MKFICCRRSREPIPKDRGRDKVPECSVLSCSVRGDFDRALRAFQSASWGGGIMKREIPRKGSSTTAFIRLGKDSRGKTPKQRLPILSTATAAAFFSPPYMQRSTGRTLA